MRIYTYGTWFSRAVWWHSETRQWLRHFTECSSQAWNVEIYLKLHSNAKNYQTCLIKRIQHRNGCESMGRRRRYFSSNGWRSYRLHTRLEPMRGKEWSMKNATEFIGRMYRFLNHAQIYAITNCGEWSGHSLVTEQSSWQLHCKSENTPYNNTAPEAWTRNVQNVCSILDENPITLVINSSNPMFCTADSKVRKTLIQNWRWHHHSIHSLNALLHWMPFNATFLTCLFTLKCLMYSTYNSRKAWTIALRSITLLCEVT